MTTLRQKLVRKKNRKLRRLRELYPDLNVKLFYARDFRALMLKYGRLALVDGLSGTLGQVAVPPRHARAGRTRRTRRRSARRSGAATGRTRAIGAGPRADRSPSCGRLIPSVNEGAIQA